MRTRNEWKKFEKKKGRLQRKRIKEHNCQLSQASERISETTKNPKTRGESKE